MEGNKTELHVCEHREEEGRVQKGWESHNMKMEEHRYVMKRTEESNCLGIALYLKALTLLLGSYWLPWGDCHKLKGLFISSGFPFLVCFVL